MATTSTIVTKISIEDIEKSYNGNQGCACGCNGEYIYANENLELVAKHLAKINARLKSNPMGVDAEYNYASIEGATRATRVYFKKGVSYSYGFFSKELERTETIAE